MRTRPHTIPEKAHPLVKLLFAELNKHDMSVAKLAEKVGITSQTVILWRTATMPRTDILEACFNALGLTLAPVPMERK